MTDKTDIDGHRSSLPPAPELTGGQAPGTRAVVDEYLRRHGDGPERIAELFAETVDWRVSWPTAEYDEVPWIRPRSTRADVAAHFRTFQEHCDADAGEVSIDQLLIDGSDAVLVGMSSQLVRVTGKRFTMAFALQLTVENGLLSRHHMYEDSLAVAEAFIPSGAPIRHGTAT
jgi:ketosteroid isomerase-like protein